MIIKHTTKLQNAAPDIADALVTCCIYLDQEWQAANALVNFAFISEKRRRVAQDAIDRINMVRKAAHAALRAAGIEK